MPIFRVLTTAALRCPIIATVPYFIPPTATSYHFSPHLKLIAFLVKQNRAFLKTFFGKVFLLSSSNFTATRCVRVACESPHLAALFSSESYGADASLEVASSLVGSFSLRCQKLKVVSPSAARNAVDPTSRNSLRDSPIPCYAQLCSPKSKESLPMEWTTPQHEEIDLNCEISSYANAEI
jgi:hypothetical protein